MMRITTLCSAFILSILSLSLFAQEPVEAASLPTDSLPVSYTHLSFLGEENKKIHAICGSKSGRNIDKVKAVSYTHLDVYKRQHRVRAFFQ